MLFTYGMDSSEVRAAGDGIYLEAGTIREARCKPIELFCSPEGNKTYSII